MLILTQEPSLLSQCGNLRPLQTSCHFSMPSQHLSPSWTDDRNLVVFSTLAVLNN